MNYYEVNDIKKEIEKRIEKNAAFLSAWEKVTFPTKKDGTPFANMQKNIDGAKYSPVSYAMQGGEYELTVYAQTPKCGYIHDSIGAYELVRYLKDEEKITKKENYMPKQTCLEQVYKFDLEDIKKAIKNRIDYLRKYVDELKQQLSVTEDIVKEFAGAYKNAMQTVENLTSCFEHKDLFYAAKEYVINRYPYI